MSKDVGSEDQEWDVVEPPRRPFSESAENGSSRHFSISVNITMNSCANHADRNSFLDKQDAIEPFSTKVETQPQSALLALPAEIRLKIYSLALKIDQPCVRLIDERSQYQYRLSLLETCRQIYHEAATIFYEVNVLRVSPKNLTLFQTLNEAQRNVIVSLIVEVINGSEFYFVLCRLHHLKNLRHLGITWDSHYTFYNVRNWRLMAPQIETELKKLPSLEKLYVVEDFGDRESLMLGLGSAPEQTREILDNLMQSVKDCL